MVKGLRWCVLGLVASFAVVVPASPGGAAFPGSNGRLVVASDAVGHFQLFTATPDGRDIRQITHGDADSFHPAWSANGQWVVFNRATPDNVVELWVVRGDGTDAHQVTHLGGQALEPAWAPDGSRIVFQFNTPNDPDQDLYTIKLDGTGLHRLTNTPDSAEVLAKFSPDGRWLVYGFATFARNDIYSRLRISKADGSDVHDITPQSWNAARPDWSPDGTRIIFSNNYGRFKPASLFTVRPDGSDLRRLTTAPANTLGDTFAVFSPDGRRVSFISDRNGTFDVFVMNADGSALHDVTPPNSSDETRVDWQPRP
jgi:TolB protein